MLEIKKRKHPHHSSFFFDQPYATQDPIIFAYQLS